MISFLDEYKIKSNPLNVEWKSKLEYNEVKIDGAELFR